MEVDVFIPQKTLDAIIKNKNIKESLKFANKQPFYDVKLKKSVKEL